MPPNLTLPFEVAPYDPTAVFETAPELDVPAVIRGDADQIGFPRARIAKNGLGRMRLSGNNTLFAGTASVNRGTLVVAHGGALGATTASTFVNDDAQLALEGGITITGETLFASSTNSPALDSRTGNNVWTGNVILGANTTINVNQTLTLSGVISGTGHLTKSGIGTLTLGGANHNTYAGETIVRQGVLHLSKPFAVTAVPGLLTIGTPTGVAAVARNFESYQVVGDIVVHRNGLLDVNGRIENVLHLSLHDGGDVQTGGNGLLIMDEGGSLNVHPGANDDSSIISGRMYVVPGTLPINVGVPPGPTGQPDLDITALISTSAGTAHLLKSGPGWLRLAGANTYDGNTLLTAGTLQVDGIQAASPVQISGGTLQGLGTIGPVSFTSSAGVIAPGTSPGVLTTGHFHAGAPGNGTLRMELNGPIPGSDHDRLNVIGTVNLNGVGLQVVAGATFPTNSQLVLITNDGADPVTGTFTGLPQGASVHAGTQVFQISYTGGDGNDVVLTKIADLPPPMLYLEKFSPTQVRLYWPTNYPDFHLQFNTNLTTTNWAAVVPAPVVVGSQFTVTNSLTGEQKLYRLFKP